VEDLPVSEAKSFLEYWSRNIGDDPSPEIILKAYAAFIGIFEAEYAECSLSQDEQLLRDFEECPEDEVVHYEAAVTALKKRRAGMWAVFIAGSQLAFAPEGKSCLGAQELYETLVDLARGVPGTDAFKIRRTSKIRPLDGLVNRARLIAAYGIFTDQRAEVLKLGVRLIGENTTSLRKMIDNFHSGREPRPDLVNLVELFKAQHEEGLTKTLEDFLCKNLHDPPPVK
jgi:hypothetical protein